MMKAYLINLDKDKRKLDQAIKRLSQVSIQPLRIAASYGRDFTKEQLREYSTERIFSQIFDPKIRYMNVGAWGCSHSHARTCKIINKGTDRMSIVLEDDFFWLDSPTRVKSILDNLLVKDVDLILLGYSPRDIFRLQEADNSGECIKIDEKYRLVPMKYIGGGAGGSYGYITSKDMASRMWPDNTIVDRDADGFRELYEREPINSKGMYIIFPPIVHSSLEGSNIWHKSNNIVNLVKVNLLKLINRNSILLRVFSMIQQRRLIKNYLSNTKVYKRNT